eukprot:UN27177
MRSYNIFSISSPYKCSCMTGIGMLSVADFTAQILTYQGDTFVWNKRRTLGMAVFGLIYYGGVLKYFYKLYDRFIGQTGLVAAATKTFIDLFINSPLVLLPMFYGITYPIKGYSKEETLHHFQTDFMEAWLGTIGFWLPGCMANFI